MTVSEVVERRHAMREMIQAAVQREPVEVFRRRLNCHLPVDDIDPPTDILIRRQTAECALPDVTVCGHEARNDKLARSIIGLARLELRGRRPFSKA